MRHAVEAGRLARGAGRIPRRLYAEASTSVDGLADLVTETDAQVRESWCSPTGGRPRAPATSLVDVVAAARRRRRRRASCSARRTWPRAERAELAAALRGRSPRSRGRGWSWRATWRWRSTAGPTACTWPPTTRGPARRSAAALGGGPVVPHASTSWSRRPGGGAAWATFSPVFASAVEAGVRARSWASTGWRPAAGPSPTLPVRGARGRRRRQRPAVRRRRGGGRRGDGRGDAAPTTPPRSSVGCVADDRPRRPGGGEGRATDDHAAGGADDRRVRLGRGRRHPDRPRDLRGPRRPRRQRDHRADRAEHGRASTACTCRPSTSCGAQLDAVLDDLPVAAVKTGMLATEEVVRAVAEVAAAGRLPNLVVDPVLVSSTGARLLDPGAERAYVDALFPHALVVTPNTREASALVGRHGRHRGRRRRGGPRDRAARSRAGWWSRAGTRSTSPAATRPAPTRSTWSSRPPPVRSPSCGPRGSTPATTTAPAARSPPPPPPCWPAGVPVPEALAGAKRFVHAGLVASAGWRLGAGHGPVGKLGAWPER